MKRVLAAAALTVLVAVGAAAPFVSAVPLPQAAASCSGVWVIVDFGSLGGIQQGCAKNYGTGDQALKSAGFSVTIEDGFIYKIAGKPSKPDINKAYWSYWHSSPTADGWSGWEYAQKGATLYQPTAGDAEGWRYQPLSEGKVAPGAKPPVATEPEPTPTPTTTKPSPKPTKTTSKPSPTPTRTSASPTPTSTTTSATPTPTPTPTPSPTTAPTTPTPSASAEPDTTDTPVEIVAAEPSETAAATPSAPEGSGSPAGAIAAVAVVVVGGAGVGTWWWLKGRKN